MARGLNKVMLIGRLGKDPELRYTPREMAVTNFTIATNEEWIDKGTGEKKVKTEWHRVVAFGKLAEICNDYLGKGRKVYVEGKIQTRSWEKEGTKHYITEIVVNYMQMLDSKDSATNSDRLWGSSENDDNETESGENKSGSDESGALADDDIPF